jgi:hypothetical protein
LYELTVHAGTWGGGSVTLQRLAADGSTTAYVPSGTYQLTIATATDVSADLAFIEAF